MVEGKKISELGLVTNINDGCCFPLLSNGATKRITFAVLLENILAQLTIPENQEIKTLKEKVNNFDSSIELTDREIEEIKNRCVELQKEIDSQDEIVVKYIKLFEELKDAYDRIEAEGMIIDDELNETSEHAIANKTVAKLVPAQASEENKLADKDFVNSSIATNTAHFIGDFESYTDLINTTKNLTNNDYAFVHSLDEVGNTQYDRYKWNGSEWKFEYTLNNSSFTSEQWVTINSNVTKEWKNETDEKLSQISSPIDDTTTATDKTWSSNKIYDITPSRGNPSSTANKDANNMTKTGFYTVGDGYDWKNLPVAIYGILKVFNCEPYVEQQFTVIGGGITRLFLRTSTNAGASWEVWRECTIK